jgi:hypothetical protein
MTTIYIIRGGGQKIRQNIQIGLPTTYSVDNNSDWVEKAKCNSSDSYTNAIWADDFETIQRLANDWAGEEIELIEESGDAE